MVGFCFSKENNSLRRVILKIELRIKQPKLNLVTVGRDSSFPSSAVALFYTDQMNRVHRFEEAPRSFTMAPCVVVERLEGKQRCSRAEVSEHAGIQARK